MSKECIDRSMADQRLLTETIREILTRFPSKPFLCLPLSAMLYAMLKDRHGIESVIVTGSLLFREEIIFKQDYSVQVQEDARFQTWAGHAWVELDNLICDISIFRTLYSDAFTKPCKSELIGYFGVGRGAIVATKENLKADGLRYIRIDELNDETATAIIRGVCDLPIWD